MKTLDLSGQKVVALRDVETALREGVSEMLVCEKTILTPSARDLIAARGLSVRRSEASNATKPGACGCAGAGCAHCPGAPKNRPAAASRNGEATQSAAGTRVPLVQALSVGVSPCDLCDRGRERDGGPDYPRVAAPRRGAPCEEDLNAIIQRVTDEVIAALNKR
jgi:hypothetical protein